MTPQALLFDFDGVIADTENIHIAAWERTLGAMGWDLSEEDSARAAEIDDRGFLAGLFEAKGIERGDVEGWVRAKQELTVQLLADSPRVYPGVVELVESLRDRLRLAIVSTTWRANITTVLAAARLSDAFEVIVGKEDVPAPKPDPQGYILALKRLRLSPAKAVVMEDSPSGLTAARAAGVRCLAVGHRRARGDWIGDARFLPDLENTRVVLDAIGL